MQADEKLQQTLLMVLISFESVLQRGPALRVRLISSQTFSYFISFILTCNFANLIVLGFYEAYLSETRSNHSETDHDPVEHYG